MPDIKMIKYHTLPLTRARALVQTVADDLAQQYGLDSRWVGNSLHFRRLGVEGHMRVDESEIDLEVTLGFLLKAFKAKFVTSIEHNFDTLLTKAETVHKTAAKKAPAKKPAKVAKKAGRKS